MTDDRDHLKIPNTSIDEPLCMDDERISLGLVEVSCRQYRLRAKLKQKTDLFQEWWDREYESIGWRPDVYKIVGHYDNRAQYPVKEEDYKAQAVILCSDLDEKVLRIMSDKDRKRLKRILKLCSRGFDEVEEGIERILKDNSAAGIQDLINGSREDSYVNTLRGALAEISMLNLIDISRPPDMKMFMNSTVKIFNERYRTGTEIDALLVFYGSNPYYHMMESLNQIPFLRVYSD